MKTKLTVTIDEELLPRAKEYARQSGSSLSELIENALRELSSDAQPDFATRWRGKFGLSSGDEERRRRLLKKYA
jgi:post-segregation antitoxin (ccd killing protein)